jgi:histone H3/H4
VEAFGETPADSFADASKQEPTGQVPDEIGASIKPLFTTTQRAHPPAMSDREFGGNDDLSLPKGKQKTTP